MISRCFLWVLAGGLFFCSAHARANEEIDRLFSNFKGSVPGAGVLIVKDGVVEYEKAYGMQRLTPSEPATIDTNFRLASLTKAFTALAIVMLEEDGLLNYEGSVFDYLDFPEYGKTIKVRHLLTHQSGLIDYEGLIPAGRTAQITDGEVLDLLREQRNTYFYPGTKYRYSNGGYVVLAMIVEALTGAKFEDFLKARIFDPLYMTKTVAYVQGVNQVEHRAYGHSRKGSDFFETDQSMTSAVLGDGGIYSSLTDMRSWLLSLRGVNPLVSAASLERIHTPAKLADSKVTNYGFGWKIDRYRAWLRYSHTGGTIGQRHVVMRFPEEDLEILVLTNRSESRPWVQAEIIAGMYLER